MRGYTQVLVAAVLGIGVAACSGSDTATSPNSAGGNASVGASASVSTAAIDNDVAVTVGNTVMADLDAMASSGVASGTVSMSVAVPNVSLTESTPTSTSGSGGTSTTGTNTTNTTNTTTTTPPKSGEHETAPAGTPPSSIVPCTFDSQKGVSMCNFSNNVVNTASTITFVDVHGVKTNGFVAGVTDTIRTTYVMSAKRTSADGKLTTSTARNMAMAVGGFINPVGNRVHNGVGAGADTSVFADSGKSRKYASATADTIKALTYAEHRALNPYPLSGTTISVLNSLLTVVDLKGTTTTTVNRRVVITFDGSATATMQVGATTCQLHLDTRKVDNCH